MIKIYCSGIDVVTYNRKTRKWEKWTTACGGRTTPSPTKKNNWPNIEKWWHRVSDSLEEAEEFISKYRSTWVSRDYKAMVQLLAEYETK